MQKEGIVSFWLGHIDSKDKLDELLNVSYTDDGGLVPSKFAQLFDINRYEDETREADFIDKPQTSLAELLEGFSYDDVIINRLRSFTLEKPLKEYNAMVLLYDYEYSGNTKIVDTQTIYFEFIGFVSYTNYS